MSMKESNVELSIESIIERDVLSEEGIRSYLPKDLKELPIEVLKSVSSTNIYAKKCAEERAERMLVLAEEQTEGRGRRGRSFYSPYGTGLYMSLLMKVERSLAQFVPITVAAAVAVTRAVTKLSGKETKIKWVNDIYLYNKKICGILAEAVSDAKSGMLTAVVVGIGVNVFTENYPEDIKDKAGSLLPGALTRNELAAEITKELLGFSKNLNAPELMEEYRRKSMVIGEEIYWMEKEIRKEGGAIGINESGNLIVETKEGKVILSAGEISVRKSC